MPLPTVISDISPIPGTGAAPNAGQPGGGENPSTFDDYLRLYAAFIAQLRAGGGLAASGANRIPFFDAAGALTSAGDFVRDASGNVGIGTSSPTRRLSIANGDVELNGNFVYLNSGNAYIQGNGANLLLFTNANERMRIDASGNVGIGTGSPGARLDVGGGLLVRGNTTCFNNQWFGTSAGSAYWPDDGVIGGSIRNGGAFYITTAGVERMRIDTSGHQINTPGSTTPPTLTVNGQFTLTPTSNTNFRISYRGTDGVTRIGNITLA